jgi:AbrB family looped-hinge helix DNA binding protein
VSSKGQITLPVDCRRALGIEPHDSVLIETQDDRIVVRPVPNLLDLEGFLGKGLGPEEEKRRMMKAVARHLRGKK